MKIKNDKENYQSTPAIDELNLDFKKKSKVKSKTDRNERTHLNEQSKNMANITNELTKEILLEKKKNYSQSIR